MPYSSKHVSTLYGIANETVRNWTNEFAEYLSPTAKPGKNRNRQYTNADMEVLSLVSERKNEGANYSDIHADLKNGQRGEAPALPPNEVQAITTTEIERRLSLQVEHLKHTIIKLQEELNLAKKEVTKTEKLKEKNIQLQTSLNHLQGVEERLENTQHRIEELSKQLGQEYARGYIEGFERNNKDIK